MNINNRFFSMLYRIIAIILGLYAIIYDFPNHP